MNQDLLKKYAELTVKVGANVQKDQKVMVRSAIDQGEFVAYIVEEAYKAGARKVEIQWDSQEIDKLQFEYASLEILSTLEPWQIEKEKQQVEDLPVMIYILSEDPDGLSGVDQEKMQSALTAKRKAVKEYRDAMENKHQWTIVAVPSKAWAKKVFPEVSQEDAVEKLWDAVLTAVRVEECNNPVDAWAEHNRNFHEKCRILSEYQFDYLHYTSEKGTDFKAWLIPGGVWLGGDENTLSGVSFNPNMPTEEVFTTPMKGRAEGTLVATMPLSYQGQLIENFSLTFADGKVVSCKAERGEKMLKEIIETDDGSCCLGELALVPFDSPISNTGILFYETLFDENASCHVALGRGFSMVLPSYETLSWEEMVEKGINDSLIHVDFMIGDATLNICGVTHSGDSVPIFSKGNWVI